MILLIFQKKIRKISNFSTYFCVIVSPHNFCNQPSLRFISRFGRFHKDFIFPFTLSIPFTSLSLSPLYPFHLSIPFTFLCPFHSLSLYPFHLSLSLFSPSLSISLLLPFSLLSTLLSIGNFYLLTFTFSFIQNLILN